MGAILVISIIAGNVLFNCLTRYTVVSNQVRSWKNAIYAAEAGGDIAYAEVRKTLADPANAWTGWDVSGSVHSRGGISIGSNGGLTSSTVDRFYYDAAGNPWYLIRARGTAPVYGLKRTGMDDRMNKSTKGDSLLRKIDFNYDHFIAAYGPKGDGVGKSLVAVAQPQITRRLELVAAPITPFEAAVKAIDSFYGPGSAGLIDSYDSSKGPYSFVADDPSDPRYVDSHSGGVAVNSADFTQLNGPIYGSVSTNGGTVVPSSKIAGTIDNNVPFSVPPCTMPDFGFPKASPTKVVSSTTITPSLAGTAAAPNYYLLTSFTDALTIQPFGTSDTYVAIHVTGDIAGNKASITVKPKVFAKIYFDGNIDLKARDIDNQSGIASHLQFYGVSPTDPAQTQSIDIAPPGDFAATFYAPSADFHMNGNPDVTGAIVCKTFYGNGNTSLHYDRALATEGTPIDYRVASYVEDLR